MYTGKIDSIFVDIDKDNHIKVEKVINECFPPLLKDLPFMTDELMDTLHKKDVYTTNQLIGTFAIRNFNYPICLALHPYMDERLLKLIFFKLEIMGFHIEKIENEGKTNSEEDILGDFLLMSYYTA